MNTPHPFAHTMRALASVPELVKPRGKRATTAAPVANELSPGQSRYFSLPALAEQYPNVSRLPVSLRIVLESVLRHCDGHRVLPAHVAELANWQATLPAGQERSVEIPFVVSRVVLQDFTGVPLLVDLAAMRSTAARLGKRPQAIEPLVPVDLVVDHSVTVDHYGSEQALDLNMKLEFQRNHERYQFLKWGMQAFKTFGVVPPGFGIVHQVNLEHLARGLHDNEGLLYPDTLVGTDSHTTMINGIGVVGWGVGGIEAEAAMLGQPVYLLTPDVVGVSLSGRLREGVTATDLVLTVTELLRKNKVVGKFVEFFGEGTRSLSVTDRATVANMAPEYGATMGFFPVDEKTLAYFQGTGRKAADIARFEAYFRAQGLFGVPGTADAPPSLRDVAYSQVIALDLGDVVPSLAGPKRPQDRIDIGQVSTRFDHLFSAGPAENGFSQTPQQLDKGFVTEDGLTLRHGDVLIAAITSCTNTSNPGVMLAAGLLAKKAVLAGLKVAPHIKTSLAPGSRIVTEYLERAGLLPYLEKLGFSVAGYGCTTCIGNAGDLTPSINQTITSQDLVCAAVLSGNRNFEARIHPNLKANFLASPPLVVAYAIAGSVRRDLMTEPVGLGRRGKPVYLGDIWPSSDEVQALMHHAMRGQAYRDNYALVASAPGKLWQKVQGVTGALYDWPDSSYIAEPPFFQRFTEALPAAAEVSVKGARIMALFGDSITTDHISPAGSFRADSPAGQYLLARGVSKPDFNSYGARRGHHEVMMRGTFANVRVKNLMLPALADGSRQEGGRTLYLGRPGSEQAQPMSIYDAAMQYQAQGIPTVVFAGEEYGTGSSRDWAAKGTQLLGIRAVVARSFERIHRSNLVGMGVLPLQWLGTDSWQSLGLTGLEVIDVLVHPQLLPQSEAVLRVTRADGTVLERALRLRIDTPIEATYYRHGGILPYVLRDLLSKA